VAIHWHLYARKSHRWGAVLIALPFLVVLITGILLQIKKEWSWVQPPTQRGEGKSLSVSFDQLLEIAKQTPEAEVQSWKDIDRIDVQPNRGIAKILTKNRWEIQVDLQTAKVLQLAYRRSDLIESMHDGSWFHDSAKLYIFLPTAVVVLALWLTGLYLFVLPNWVRWTRKKA
jgi:uncharacterized iron-regulated membrane protein